MNVYVIVLAQVSDFFWYILDEENWNKLDERELCETSWFKSGLRRGRIGTRGSLNPPARRFAYDKSTRTPVGGCRGRVTPLTRSSIWSLGQGQVFSELQTLAANYE